MSRYREFFKLVVPILNKYGLEYVVLEHYFCCAKMPYNFMIRRLNVMHLLHMHIYTRMYIMPVYVSINANITYNNAS